MQTVRAANFEPNAVIYSPRTAGNQDHLKDTTNQPLLPPPSVDGLLKLAGGLFEEMPEIKVWSPREGWTNF